MFKHVQLSQMLKLSLLAATLTLAACSDDDTLRGGDDHSHVESSGRLAFARADGTPQLVMYDLDSRTSNNINLGNAPSAVYASPGNRFAIVPQSAAGLVNFVDGGVYLHGDHAHADAPSLLAFSLTGVKPAHYNPHEDQATLFFDGAGADAAKFVLFDDASLDSGKVIATQILPAAVHGLAEPRDGYVLSIDYSAEEAAALTVRNAVKLYGLHGDHFHDEGRFTTPCLGLHGGAGNEDAVAFGCKDGVLLIEQNGSTFTDSKIPTASAVSQIAGHHEVSFLIGFAGAADGDTLYIIDPAAKTATPFDWKAGATVNRLQYGFDAHGENFLILDSAGTLHVFGVSATGLSPRGKVSAYVGNQSAARFTTSAAGDQAFVTDPAGKSIVVVDLEPVAIVNHIDLDFAPVGVAWLGVGEEHAH